MRGDRLEQITFDHSLVWEMRALGQLSANSDVSKAIPKNVITRSLGPNTNVQVDVEGPHPVEVGDTFLLCSDGLSGEVTDDELGPILANLPPRQAAQVLVDLANLRGGPDNITVIVAKVTGERLATNAVEAQPVTIGGAKQRKQVHPAIWAASAVFLLVGIGMMLADYWIPAGMCSVVGLVGLGFAGYIMLSPGPPGVALGSGKRLGKGPYTNTVCSAGKEFIGTLAKIVNDLREAGTNWSFDEDKFNALVHEAEQSAKSGERSQAVRQYASSISFMMEELRRQNKKDASDSAVDY
jgi:protein phosphatase